MRFCANPDCFNQLNKKQTRFCSKVCASKSRRGSGKAHIRIRKNGKRVYLHREIFEANYRPLLPGEIVHHIDGNNHNNAPENLEALKGQAAHLHKHDYWRASRVAKNLEAYDPDFGW